jgi:hypothetical protein
MGISDPLYGAVPDRPDRPDPMLSIREDTPPNSIVLNGGGNVEMLRVAKDGFYVRGEKVPMDDKEAETVYNAFLQWMSYMALTRNY